jgi:hydroxypyruvate isomerase
MPRIAANLAYLFTERPLIERFGAAAAAGFKAVELQFPYDVAPSAVKAELERHGLAMLGLNTMRGREDEFGLAAETVFIANLARAAEAAAKAGITLLIEPINPRDRPNYFLNRVEHAADIVAKIGAPNVRIQFDFYHVQIIGGDLITRFEKHLPVVGHVQIAAVPSRHEPDEGEINYPAVFAAIDRAGYRGWVACEYRPRGRTEDGLAWARPYGVVPRTG